MRKKIADISDELCVTNDIRVIVIDSGVLDAFQVKVKPNALMAMLFVAIDADPARHYQIAHEYAVRFSVCGRW